MNEIYTAYVSWPGGGKRRPVLIVQESSRQVDVLRITSRYKNKSARIKRNYYPLSDWQKEGLHKRSYVDTGAIQSLLKIDKLLFYYVGKLTISDEKNLAAFIRDKYRNN